MNAAGEDGPRPGRRGPGTLWTVAAALVVISVVVSVFTPMKLFILFLPLGLAPLFWSSRSKR